MKVLKTYEDKCISCHVCESTCSNLYFKEDNADLSCIQIHDDNTPPEMNVCNQCQTCVAACPTCAITVNSQGVVMISRNLCIGCLMCVAVCPTNSMRTAFGKHNPFKCIACGACVKTCPAEALAIVQE
ncbi:MAG TPA: 4Fe-4S binding protein [Candidatus Cloacimonadota bacterium]|jgi:anaerobic carbon-monoxide dehydrogenase iron sulfur subunit|nr:4Fe-4S binding protein [Candidatus Cloacimonadota bacterium]